MSSLTYFAFLLVTAFALCGLVEAAPRPNSSAVKEEVEKKDFVNWDNRTLANPEGSSVTGNAEAQDTHIAVCPPGYEPVEVYCYKINFQLGEHHQQQDLCFQSGGYLVTITSKEENDALLNYMRSLKLDGSRHGWLHIGLKDVRYSSEHNQFFSWTGNYGMPYENWSPGSPSSNECGYLLLDTDKFGEWADSHCNRVRGAICEANPLAKITLANQ